MPVRNLVAAVALALLVFWAVGAHNRLVRLKHAIAQAFGPLDVQLKRRYELIFQLIEAARKYLQQEPGTLDALLAARNQARSANDALRSRPANAAAVSVLVAAEQALDGSLRQLFALAEAHPELQADPTLRELREELGRTDNKAAFACQAYNDAALAYNNAQGQFPALLIARLFGLAPSALLCATERAREGQASWLGCG